MISIRTSLALVALASCGGTTDSDLFGPPPSDASSSIDSSRTDATMTTHDASMIVDGAMPPLEGGPSPVDANVPIVDAGVDPGIYCGVDLFQTTQYCALPGNYCCVGQGLAGPTYSCQSSFFGNCNGNVAVNCDNGSECDGGICCGDLVSQFGPAHYESVSCKAACAGAVAGNDQIRFCNPNAKPSECAKNQSCKADSTLTGYFSCQN